MEKFGLFDLIDKFNAVANGKNDFSKPAFNAHGNPPAKETADEKGTGEKQSKLVDPQIFPPAQYLMNAKMLDFNKKHDEFARRVK
ncbi:MAG: hypothetical protein IJY84_06795 [Clostridia bacterium]|nr:hypothetical protein [Clostridia bacterium]